jgi:hypothetical protein
MNDDLELALKFKYPKTFRMLMEPPPRMTSFQSLKTIIRVAWKEGGPVLRKIEFIIRSVWRTLTYKILKDNRRGWRSGMMVFGIECGNGWYKLIDDLASKIEPLIKEPFCYASQVKEKFASLRFYMSCYTDDISELIEKAEDESSRTCEVCGKPGACNGSGWLTVLCKDCRNDAGK